MKNRLLTAVLGLALALLLAGCSQEPTPAPIPTATPGPPSTGRDGPGPSSWPSMLLATGIGLFWGGWMSFWAFLREPGVPPVTLEGMLGIGDHRQRAAF